MGLLHQRPDKAGSAKVCVALQCAAQLKVLSHQKPAEGCMPLCKGSPQHISELEKACLADTTMLCNAVFSSAPAVHCLQQDLANAAGPGSACSSQGTVAKHGAKEPVLL